MQKDRKQPRDPNAKAHYLVGRLTGVIDPPVEAKRDPAAVERGRKGGAVGGKARAAALSPKARQAIARAAAVKRWGTKNA